MSILLQLQAFNVETVVTNRVDVGEDHKDARPFPNVKKIRLGRRARFTSFGRCSDHLQLLRMFPACAEFSDMAQHTGFPSKELRDLLAVHPGRSSLVGVIQNRTDDMTIREWWAFLDCFPEWSDGGLIDIDLEDGESGTDLAALVNAILRREPADSKHEVSVTIMNDHVTQTLVDFFCQESERTDLSLVVRYVDVDETRSVVQQVKARAPSATCLARRARVICNETANEEVVIEFNL